MAKKTTVATKDHFLPDGYVLPTKADQFMKLKLGENRIRIMTPALAGWELFIEDGLTKKPIRRPEDEELDREFVEKNKATEEDEVHHFWAMIVWNYELERFQCLSLTQTTIKKAIIAFLTDPDYGDSRGFDIKITREGEGKTSTKYTTMPSPPKTVKGEISDAFSQLEFDLRALFKGEYPFK